MADLMDFSGSKESLAFTKVAVPVMLGRRTYRKLEGTHIPVPGSLFEITFERVIAAGQDALAGACVSVRGRQ